MAIEIVSLPIKNGDFLTFHSYVSLPESKSLFCKPKSHMGVSENSVPLNPMVNDHYPY